MSPFGKVSFKTEAAGKSPTSCEAETHHILGAIPIQNNNSIHKEVHKNLMQIRNTFLRSDEVFHSAS